MNNENHFRELAPPNRRWFDVGLAGLALVLLSPVLAIVAVLVRLKLGTPILFTQTRTGLHGRPFTIYKFRTMTNACDATGRRLSDAERLTRFGQWLRGTSLDELPELFNVIKGDMSVVGPRPLLMEYLALYSPEQMRRHDVLPGITGWPSTPATRAIPIPRRLWPSDL